MQQQKQTMTAAATNDVRDDERLITVKQAAEMLGLSVSSVYELMTAHEGRPPALPYHKIGKARRIALRDVRKLIAETRVGAGA